MSEPAAIPPGWQPEEELAEVPVELGDSTVKSRRFPRAGMCRSGPDASGLLRPW
jgi:hypothetical protein